QARERQEIREADQRCAVGRTPRPAPDPRSGFAISEADWGVGRGPGGPPHMSLMMVAMCVSLIRRVGVDNAAAFRSGYGEAPLQPCLHVRKSRAVFQICKYEGPVGALPPRVTVHYLERTPHM